MPDEREFWDSLDRIDRWVFRLFASLAIGCVVWGAFEAVWAWAGGW